MTEDGSSGAETVFGVSIDAATERIVADVPARDPQRVRETLQPYAEDGVVTEAAFDRVQSNVSNLLATAESRAEFAELELEDARETAEDVSDFDVVQSRLDVYADQIEAVTDRAADLGPTFGREVTRADSTCEAMQALQSIADEAKSVQMTADELVMDAESFGRWVGSPHYRRQETGEDVDALEDSIERTETLVEALTADNDAVDHPAVAWFDVTLQRRVIALLLEDVRAEVEVLQTWETEHTEGGLDEDARDAFETIESRLDDLDDRLRAIETALADLRREELTARFDDRLDRFDSLLAGVEPPVDWGAVQQLLARFRPDPSEHPEDI